MPGWGRPLAGYLVSDPPLVELTDTRSRGIQVHQPRDPRGPNIFPSDWSDPRVTQTRLTRARFTDLHAEVWIRSQAGDTAVRFTDTGAEVWTRLYSFVNRGFPVSPNQGPRTGIPSKLFQDALTFQTIPGVPPDPSPTLAIGILDDRFRPKKLDGIGSGPYRLAETGTGRFGPAPIGPVIPTIGLVVTQLDVEVWIRSPTLPNLTVTDNAAEVWMTSDRSARYAVTQQTAEVWTRLSALPSGVTYTFLWVD